MYITGTLIQPTCLFSEAFPGLQVCGTFIIINHPLMYATTLLRTPSSDLCCECVTIQLQFYADKRSIPTSDGMCHIMPLSFNITNLEFSAHKVETLDRNTDV